MHFGGRNPAAETSAPAAHCVLQDSLCTFYIEKPPNNMNLQRNRIAPLPSTMKRATTRAENGMNSERVSIPTGLMSWPKKRIISLAGSGVYRNVYSLHVYSR